MPRVLWNKEKRTSKIRTSEWNGEKIDMERFNGPITDYAETISVFDMLHTRFAFAYGSCEWRQIPHLLVALHLERIRLAESGIDVDRLHLPSIDEREGGNRSHRQKCGSVAEFLRSYLP